MKRTSLLVTLAALLLAPLARAQVYPFFPPPGLTYNATTGAISWPNTCVAGEIIFNGATYQTCSAKWVWSDAPGSLTSLTAGPAELWNFQDTNGATNQKEWDIAYLHNGTNTETLSFRLLDDSAGNPTQWLRVNRNGTDSGSCFTGVVTAGYLPCQIVISALSADITIGPQNTNFPNGPPYGYRMRCFGNATGFTYNDMCILLFGNHAQGNQGWTALQEYGTINSARIGFYREYVPSTATSASTASTAPKCGETLLANPQGYGCWVFPPSIYWQITDPATSATGVGGTAFGQFIKPTVGSGQVNGKLGETTNTASTMELDSMGVSWVLSNAAITETGVTTGTNADFLCLSAGGVLLLQASACTISSLRFKRNVHAFTDDPLAELDALQVDSYQIPGANVDQNASRVQIGLVAENIAAVEPRCAVYEDDLKTPKSYRPECITALLVSAAQEFHRRSAQQFRAIYFLLAALLALALHSGHLHARVRRLGAARG